MDDITLTEIDVTSMDRMTAVLGAHFEATRVYCDRKEMKWEEDRSRLMMRLRGVETELQETKESLAKLEKKHHDTKQSMKSLTQKYVEFHQQLRSGKPEVLVEPTGITLGEHSSSLAVPMQNTINEFEGGTNSEMEFKPKVQEMVIDNRSREVDDKTFAVAKKSKGIKRILSAGSAVERVAAAFANAKKKRPEVSASARGEPLPCESEKEDQMNGPGAIKRSNAIRNNRTTQKREDAKQHARSEPVSSSRRSSKVNSSVKEKPYVQVNLTKEARAQLPGRTCCECEAFYKMQKAKGMSSQEIQEVLNNCSRHRQQWTPATTPEGFWNLSVMSMPTPIKPKRPNLDSIDMNA